MSNPEDDKPLALDDELYDDVLGDSFEDEFDDDFSDLDLDVEMGDDDFATDYTEDLSDNTVEAGADLDSELEDFDGFDDEWDDEGATDNEFAGAGAQKEKRSFDLSFNTIAITGAVILGVAVLGYQVTTKKPQAMIERFVSALNMQGASDGPIFGDEEIQTTQLDLNAADDNTEEAFLYNPESLDALQAELKDTPPMPAPMSAEPETVAEVPNIEDIITPLPQPTMPAPAVAETQANPVPRAPEAAEIVSIPDNKITNKVDNALSALIDNDTPEVADIIAPEVAAVPDAQTNQAEEFLKSTIQARNEKEGLPIAKAPTKIEKPSIAPSKIATPVQATIRSVDTAVNTSAIEQKLDMIMSRLDAMETQITQVRESGNVKIEGISNNVTALKQELTQIAKAPAPKRAAATPVIAKKAVQKTPVKKVAPKTPRASTPKAQTVKWELRAAQPGKAWVSKQGQKDMQPVVVGDQLPNIGRITAISYNGSRWTVSGTSGQILQ